MGHHSLNIIIRPRTEADDPAIVEIFNTTRPWLPRTTVDEFRWQADPANVPSGQIQERWVAERQGTVLGIYSLGESMFVAREHTFGAGLGVAEAHRNQGVGDQLYRHLMDRALSHGATRIYSEVSENNDLGAGFAKRRGFSKTGRAARLSCLKVAEATLDGEGELIDRLEAEGIVFKSMDEIGHDEPALRKIYDLEYGSAYDVPRTEEFGVIPFQVWIKWMAAPNRAPALSWIAYDGDRPVGMASITLRGADRSGFHDYTGVDREYRGRGIARALKCKTIESAREDGIASIFTANDYENKPILAINIPLGYQAVPAELEIVKDL